MCVVAFVVCVGFVGVGCLVCVLRVVCVGWCQCGWYGWSWLVACCVLVCLGSGGVWCGFVVVG